MIIRIDTEKQTLTVQGWVTDKEKPNIKEELNEYFYKNKWKGLKIRFKTKETPSFEDNND